MKENKKWKEKLREIFFIQGKYKDQAIGLDDWEQFISQLLEDQKQEIIEKVKRIKLDMDVVVCDCGEPYKDSDPADLINELLEFLT